MKTILAIDPGTHKCGIAVVTNEAVIHKEVATRSEAVQIIINLAKKYAVDEIIVGDGTGSGKLVEELKPQFTVSISLVDEKFSTQKARVRYFKENPPRGLRKLIPRGLLVPDRPYDDLIAVLLAEKYLASN
jgi:RNase H-fold protein (predicted Holliday junction resolvase)